MRYRILTASPLIITKPNGDVVQREVVLAYDTQDDTFDVRFKGESQLKGYTFSLLHRELRRVLDAGQPAEKIPKTHGDWNES